MYTVRESRGVPSNRPVLEDEFILFTGQGALEKCPHPMRRIEFYDADTARTFIFVTNNMKLAAATIAAIYKDRGK